jgi:hypothetical protein
MLCITPALVQDTFWFKEYKSRGLLNVEETPALNVLFQLIFLNQGQGDKPARGYLLIPSSANRNAYCSATSFK